MAKKEEKGKKGKKTALGIATIILVPILIVVLIAGSLFAIFEALTNLLKNLVGEFLRSMIDFLNNPVNWVKSKWADFTNWLDTHWGIRR